MSFASPELLAAAVIGLALAAYALLGGADFGAGVWEFNSAFRTSERERALIQRAVGPVWEANHVWLLFALVISHTAFPLAFQAASQALWMPLFLALVGIVFRGVGFVFRAYALDSRTQQSLWGAVFALASTAAPFFFGTCIGAIASGQLAIDSNGQFVGDHLSGWLQPLSLFSGFFAVGICAYLSAVYLTREAQLIEDSQLLETWRRRALLTGMAMGLFAAAGLALVAQQAPALWQGLTAGWALIAASALSGFGSLWFLHKRQFNTAILAAASAVIAVMLGWMLAQYPYLLPPNISMDMAKGPANVIWAALIAAAAGAMLLIPALLFLFSLFKGATASSEPPA